MPGVKSVCHWFDGSTVRPLATLGGAYERSQEGWLPIPMFKDMCVLGHISVMFVAAARMLVQLQKHAETLFFFWSLAFFKHRLSPCLWILTFSTWPSGSLPESAANSKVLVSYQAGQPNLELLESLYVTVFLQALQTLNESCRGSQWHTLGQEIGSRALGARWFSLYQTFRAAWLLI